MGSESALVSTRDTPASQARRRAVSGVIGPASSSSQRRPSRPLRLCRSTVTTTWGRSPATWGLSERSSQVRQSSIRASARRWGCGPGVFHPVPRPGILHRTQRTDEGLAGLGVEVPVDPDRALHGGRDVQVAALVEAPGPLLSPCGIGGLAPVGDGCPEFTCRQYPSGVHEHPFCFRERLRSRFLRKHEQSHSLGGGLLVRRAAGRGSGGARKGLTRPGG